MKTVLYTKDFNEKIDYPVNVILSPQFYWIKKIDIPIKSLYQAKKIAKNMFDLNENEYIFDAFKIKDSFFAYAVKKDLNLQIPKKYIKNIYLAQSELYDYDCINVSENHSIQKIEDILFCFPKKENCPFFSEILPKIKLSKNKINLNTVNIDKSSLILLFLIFITANLSFLIPGILYKKTLKELENKKYSLSAKYNLPPTTFQIEAIYSELKETDKKQKTIKKDLEFFSKAPLKKENKFIKLAFDSKNYSVVIKTKHSFDDFFKKRFNIISSSLKDEKYTAKLGHE